MLLDGLHIPLTTPFYPDGRVYLRKLEHNAERYSRTPAAGLAILTRTGEASLVSDEETRQILSSAASASAPEKVMIAGTARDGVLNTLEMAEYAAGVGYDVLLLRVPRELEEGPTDTKSLLTYFQAVADRSPLPILLEEHRALPLEVIAELSENPSFLGIRLADGTRESVERVRAAAAQSSREVLVTNVFAAVTRRMRTPAAPTGGGNYISAETLTGGNTALATAPPAPPVKTRLKKVGFQVLTSDTATFFEGLENGAAGAMLPFACCAPQAVYEVLAAWKDGNPKLALEKQSRLLAAAREIESKAGVGALKFACDLNGYFGGKPRLPLLPATGAERSAVESLMSPMRN